MVVKNEFFHLGNFKLCDGSEIRFREDVWLGRQSFMNKYNELCRLVRRKNGTVQRVLQGVPLNLSFRLTLTGLTLLQWNRLILEVSQIVMYQERGTFIWGLQQSGVFYVKSMCRASHIVYALP